MNMVDRHPIDHCHHRSPPARWNHGVWKTDSAAMKEGSGGRKSSSAGNRRSHWRKKFGCRFAPLAPRNTTSFIIRAKRCGGIASILSPPCAVLKTPVLSPVAEVLVDMAKAEWGVDGYGTMKGLIRLRGEGRDEDEEVSSSVDELSEFELKEDVEVESRPELDLSRFELIYPTVFELVRNGNSGRKAVLETRLEYQEIQVARLEEEKVMMNENLSRLEREMDDLKWRIRRLEVLNGAAAEGSDSTGMRRWEAGSEKSIGNGCDAAAGLY